MSTSENAPALTDARGMGGVIAQDGFDYQLYDGLARLPAWLANPAFEQMIFEGLEDLEARFFAPHAPRERLLERFQAKAGSLAPADVREVFETFAKFEAAFPHATRVHTLVTPRLPPTVSWLARDPSRVRKARPFYAPFADMMAASDAELRKRLIETYGDALGTFVSQSVEVSERNLPDRDSALATFGVELDRTFPSLEAPQRRIAEVFEALSGLARRSIGAPLGRAILLRTIEDVLGRSLPLPDSFPIQIRSDRNEINERSLEIDASAFSGREGTFPGPAEWADDLVAPLDRTARWLRSHAVSRIALSGSYRLTTAVVLGWSLRAAIGFELEMPTREGAWATDDRPSSDHPAPAWHITEPTALHGDRLVISVGILRDPATDLLETAGIPSESVLSLFLDAPITSAKSAQAAVSTIKRAADTAVARLRPQGIQLFFAGPAVFAVALGHRWNAMPPTQLHEFVTGSRVYVATALI
ncbi:SAVED domain-containing protein [Rhizobium lentis]|uniref:SAVED domain-containing protein n=1 Tax=Rhizobium lentis TaxID=1138194 RepID=UPI001C836D8D|nr:SAVED domain-containing protein [Rhizobium lentis]MBX5141228.1 SAVED domain-containing protein [Rhizobium lentis]